MLFNNNIEPSCSYCRFGTHLGSDEYACSKRGIMTGEGSCGSFKYEPTKRVPDPAPIVRETSFTKEDFTL